MRLWKIILTLVLLAVWLPTTAHCGLESFGALPVEECCTEESPGAHQCESGCGIVEDGGFKTECAHDLPVPPNTLAIIGDLARSATAISAPLDRPLPPFEAGYLPQFVIQTALPIRAPSIAS